MTYLSSNFTLEEACFSQTASRLGLNNIPPDKGVHDRMTFAAYAMEVVRLELNDNPCIVSRWYRSDEVNKAEYGSERSEHIYGECVDFTCPRFGTPLQIVDRLNESAIDFRELIVEFDWVHIDFGGTERRVLIRDISGTHDYTRNLSL